MIGSLLFSCTSNRNANSNEGEEFPKTIVFDEAAPEEIASEEDDTAEVQAVSTASQNTIRVALLLDTSSSMDGLIEQAKSQLWKIVNQLALAKKGEDYANILIALYEYGNDGINSETGYVRQVVELTDDLDKLSEELFALSTNGGSENCGQVIAKSLDELAWEKETAGLQVMFIAGNEPFTQGRVNYEKACTDATGSDIIVNTIYCGDNAQGISEKWKHGADLTDGFYGSIEMNETTVYIETPFDDQIEALNAKLNDTYLAFGSQKDYYKSNQTRQDNNSSLYGRENVVERTITKSSHVYKNATWDLVDAIDQEDFDVTKVETKDLPDEMKEMTDAEKIAYVELKANQREKIQQEIKALGVKRADYIAQKQEESGEGSNGLDYAMMKAIKEQAEAKNFIFN
ncbi:MAG: VWA domain-containing protein [Crocinitomix sp.]|nr:VWA domain-containing protein [Crocinitomix sp.]